MGLYGHPVVFCNSILKLQRKFVNIGICCPTVQYELHPVHPHQPAQRNGHGYDIFTLFQLINRNLQHGSVPCVVRARKVPECRLVVFLPISILLVHGKINVVV